MKNLWLVLLAVCFATTVAIVLDIDAEEVSSVNVVGYKKISLPPGGKYLMVAVNFDAFEETILGVFGTNNLTRAGKATLADNIYLYDPAKGGSGGYWQYYQDAAGDFRTVVGAVLTNNAPLVAGQSFWIRSPSSSTLTNEITMMGQVVDSASQSVPMVEGFQMVGYGFSIDVALSNTAFFASGGTGSGKATLADNMFIWDANKGVGGGYHALYLDLAGAWREQVGAALATNIIGMGEGFWYDSKVGSWNWVETNQYLSNL